MLCTPDSGYEYECAKVASMFDGYLVFGRSVRIRVRNSHGHVLGVGTGSTPKAKCAKQAEHNVLDTTPCCRP